ncbi:hypothetical protein EMIHUDRAFT_218715 [Emiliania huxleyi CCMP1516]|uniref:J domain-containing protein n=2 Tax=Emiliania huxleyi TaxID=2903 RepID=A0A0D3I6U3_EMIH1|nr:hypothetical protein EMIHUDRAFT_218715 [Emiliania huxleyi CCMP1516]EOD06978.1 hypothetical protein EMIHUDRAFT_218715 [Emiliania huxleyi CCMP1516]|eukprot:XP_005759407.1 hypothetical protein EMIHUDRAFT_218715 [Emiliania huxleyi CCMP1516]
MPSHSAYATLGVPRGATAKEIRIAYRDKCLLLHPDRTAAPSRGSSAAFLAVQEAYETLKDDLRRREHDASLTARARRPRYDPELDSPEPAPSRPNGPALSSLSTAALGVIADAALLAADGEETTSPFALPQQSGFAPLHGVACRIGAPSGSAPPLAVFVLSELPVHALMLVRGHWLLVHSGVTKHKVHALMLERLRGYCEGWCEEQALFHASKSLEYESDRVVTECSTTQALLDAKQSVALKATDDWGGVSGEVSPHPLPGDLSRLERCLRAPCHLGAPEGVLAGEPEVLHVGAPLDAAALVRSVGAEPARRALERPWTASPHACSCDTGAEPVAWEGSGGWVRAQLLSHFAALGEAAARAVLSGSAASLSAEYGAEWARAAGQRRPDPKETSGRSVSVSPAGARLGRDGQLWPLGERRGRARGGSPP